MADAAAQIDAAPTSLSFVHAVELIRVAIDAFQLVAPAHHDLLYQRLLRDIAACRLPARARRTTPRVVKRKMSKFALKRGGPPPASQHLVAFAATILVLPQEAPAQQTLAGPPPFDETVDTTALVLCLN
jgi:hypothetical protein